LREETKHNSWATHLTTILLLLAIVLTGPEAEADGYGSFINYVRILFPVTALIYILVNIRTRLDFESNKILKSAIIGLTVLPLIGFLAVTAYSKFNAEPIIKSESIAQFSIADYFNEGHMILTVFAGLFILGQLLRILDIAWGWNKTTSRA